MSREIIDLAREDTNLKKVSVNEYAGPCPNCGGRDRFHVNLAKREGRGAWMCRVCHPAEEMGWGDAIEYLRKFRTMSFQEAKTYLQDGIESLIERVDQGKLEASSENEPPKEQWQERTARYVERAVYRLWRTPAGAPCLEYLHARGLQDETIKAAQLGYVEDEEDGELIPRLVIPWHAGNGQYWAVNRRDLRTNKPKDAPRYKMIAWSNRKAMYGCGLLTTTRRFLTFVVEGELDALTLAQETRDLPVNVVASGGDGIAATKWLVRLSRMPLVLLAQDSEQRGDQMAAKWLEALQGHATRYKPIVKDVNAMLVEGWSVRAWVEAALEMLPIEPSNLNRALFPAHGDQAPASSTSSAATADQSVSYTTPAWLEAASTPDYQDARVVAALPGAPFGVQQDVSVLLTLMEDQDQVTPWLKRAAPAWSARDSAVLYELAEEIDFPGDKFLARCGLLVEQDQAAGRDVTLDLEINQAGAGLQDDGAAFLDQVKSLVADVLPDGWSACLVDDAFAARIHALPDQVAQATPAPGLLEPLPRLKCPAEIMATRDIPGETKKNRSQIARLCTQKPLANGWCKDHQKAPLLLDMGAALGYPRVEVSDCNVIPAGRRGWERYTMGDGGFRAALPRVKRLLDQAQRDQQRAAG